MAKKPEKDTRIDRTTQHLSGLANSEGFLQYADVLRETGQIGNYSVLYFNLKGFGQINRKFGSETGDEIIIRYGEVLHEYTTEEEFLGHLGEDTFIALILRKNRDMFLNLLIRGVLVETKTEKGKSWVSLSAVVGVWDVDGDIKDLRDVITYPSIAMTHAKYELHQSHAFASKSVLARATQREEILDIFHDSIEKKEFEVYYQPKVDSRDGKLIGAEGLVRWKHNDEMISPGAFIPTLEMSGEILFLDYYVLERVCEDIKKWKETGQEPVTVSVNFSRKDLKDRELAENILGIIKKAGIDKELIEIEVTETVDDEEHEILTAFLDKLYEMGIHTAIDDFGSGYSSLATLREFKVSTLKIDRSFINTDDFSWRDEVILTDIIHMALQLGMSVITEGVEREDQLVFVNNAGCFAIQGYYYDRPLPHDEFEKRLKDKQYGKK